MFKVTIAFVILVSTNLVYSQDVVRIRGVDHIAVTVPDIDQATTFFKDMFGCEPFYRIGPYENVGEFGKSLDVPPDTTLVAFQLIRCGFGANLELFQYKQPKANKNYPNNSDVGGHHIAFYVDSIDDEIEKLKSKGIEVLGQEANRNVAGPNAGSSWIYFKAPWGLTLELVSFPNGQEYEKTSKTKLWDPKHPDK